MKLREVYVCEDCGLELEVVKECCDEETEGAACGCAPCAITCCDKELAKNSDRPVTRAIHYRAFAQHFVLPSPSRERGWGVRVERRA